MGLRATIKAVAFLLNGAVFLVGIARMQGRLAPPDVIYVGLLLATPAVSWLGLVLGYRRQVDEEVLATVKAGVTMLNVLVFVFVIRLMAMLESDVRADQGMWLVLLFAAPPVNALAILPRRQIAAR